MKAGTKVSWAQDPQDLSHVAVNIVGVVIADEVNGFVFIAIGEDTGGLRQVAYCPVAGLTVIA